MEPCLSCGERHPAWSSCKSWRAALRKVDAEDGDREGFEAHGGTLSFEIFGFVPIPELDAWKRRHNVA